MNNGAERFALSIVSTASTWCITGKKTLLGKDQLHGRRQWQIDHRQQKIDSRPSRVAALT
jgi:hypothetical protein